MAGLKGSLNRPMLFLLLGTMFFGLALPFPAQVHVERSQDGKIVITDQDQGGQRVYGLEGAALVFRHREHHLEIFDPSRQAWIAAPADYPLVQAGQQLLLAYGPGIEGSAVYDLSRHAWVPEFDGYNQGAVSDRFAVGFGGPGRIGLYDARTGRWQSPNITGEEVALSDHLVAFYGPSSNTNLYDAQRDAWMRDFSSFSRCTLGERIAVFYGPPGTNTMAYDEERATKTTLIEPVDEVAVEGDLAVVLGPRQHAYVFCAGDGAWTEYRGDARHISVRDGQAMITGSSGDLWVYVPGRRTFEKIPG